MKRENKYMENNELHGIDVRPVQIRKMSRTNKRKNIITPYWIEIENCGKRWMTLNVDITIDEPIRMSILRGIFHNRKIIEMEEEEKNGLRWKKIKIEKR